MSAVAEAVELKNKGNAAIAKKDWLVCVPFRGASRPMLHRD